MALEISPGEGVDMPGGGSLDISGSESVEKPDTSGDLEISPGQSFEKPAQIVVNLPTPMFQVVGGQIYKLLIETIARQVKMSDGIDVETRVNVLERALAANTTTRFADTIAARDKLPGLIPGDMVIVLDATADETVDKGGARYIYMPDLSFRKISEDESMDIVCNWAHLEDKPKSSVEDIDLAVAKQHTHQNKTELDQLFDDGVGNLLYKGKRINDGLVEVACASMEGIVPENLRDGGLVIINPAGAVECPNEPEQPSGAIG